jgi:Acetoacetate decarboxylase (ADC)
VAERTGENTWQVQGSTVTLPVAIRDSAVAIAVFSCSAGAARTAVADNRLTPLTIAGRGFASLVFVKYRDSDLGAYDEVGLSVAVRGPAHGAIGTYIVELPVTQTFTLEAGRAIWGLPKWLAQGTISVRPGGVQACLCDGAQSVLTAALDVGGLRIPVPITIPVVCWAVRPDGRKWVSYFAAPSGSGWRACASGWAARGSFSVNIGWRGPPAPWECPIRRCAPRWRG